MPIRPENRKRYPPDWPEISRQIRWDRARGRCECKGECGRGHVDRCRWRAYQALTDRIGGPVVILTVAHLNHTPEDCRPENLKAMCQGCHLAYDREHHARTRAATMERRRAEGMDPLF